MPQVLACQYLLLFCAYVTSVHPVQLAVAIDPCVATRITCTRLVTHSHVLVSHDALNYASKLTRSHIFIFHFCGETGIPDRRRFFVAEFLCFLWNRGQNACFFVDGVRWSQIGFVATGALSRGCGSHLGLPTRLRPCAIALWQRLRVYACDAAPPILLPSLLL
jgi:hypothetical protein